MRYLKECFIAFGVVAASPALASDDDNCRPRTTDREMNLVEQKVTVFEGIDLAGNLVELRLTAHNNPLQQWEAEWELAMTNPDPEVARTCVPLNGNDYQPVFEPERQTVTAANDPLGGLVRQGRNTAYEALERGECIPAQRFQDMRGSMPSLRQVWQDQTSDPKNMTWTNALFERDGRYLLVTQTIETSLLSHPRNPASFQSKICGLSSGEIITPFGENPTANMPRL